MYPKTVRYYKFFELENWLIKVRDICGKSQMCVKQKIKQNKM